MAKRIPARLTPAELRRFGLLVGGVFALLGGVVRWRGGHVEPVVLWILGGSLMLTGLLAPALLAPVYRAWMGLAHVISKVTTPIVMGGVYYLVMTPMGLLARLFGHRPLEHRGESSYWITRAADNRRSNMSRQF
ncbi:MAG: SxtJ family membrane protein [Gemmatimonadota bacterium]